MFDEVIRDLLCLYTIYTIYDMNIMIILNCNIYTYTRLANIYYIYR